MAARLGVILLWTLMAMPLQAVMLLFPGPGKQWFAMVYWRGVARALGLRVSVIGNLEEHRPVLFIANHSSWLDIVALGTVLPGCFVAKADIAKWPFVSWVARLGRTVFVTRNRASIGREQDVLSERLAAGDNIILFPEGTTSDGTRVLPFASSFLALASAPAKPWVQPVTLVYDRLDGLPVRRGDRPGISWYGDMDMASHYNGVGRRCSLHATIVLDSAIAPGTFTNRKTLSAALELQLAENAAALRQGRFAP
jgi:lyso-ornithine lipid O-acyltransferase